MNNLKLKRIRLVYIIGIALLLVSLCTGLFAVPQVYAGSPSGARHAAADSGGGSGGDGGGSGGASGNSGTPIALEEVPVDTSGGDGTGTGDEGEGGDVDGTIAGADISDPNVVTGGACIYTDKDDYAPYESPIITGTGFAANSEFTITITAPDGTTSYVSGVTDSQGNFLTSYDGYLCEGGFTATATDGTNTASTNFTDAPWSVYTITFKQDGLVSALVDGNPVILSIPGLFGSTDVRYNEMSGSSGYSIDRSKYSHVFYSYTDIVNSSAAGTRFKLTGIDGPGSGFWVTSDETITGNYGTQYLLTIVSPYGSTNPAVGSYWYDAGTKFRNNPNSNQELTPYVTPLEVVDGGTTYQFVEWIGDGPSNNSADNIVGNTAYTHNFNLDGPRTVEAIWTAAGPTQFYLTVDSPFGLYSDSGDGWYDSGTTAYASLNVGMVETIPNDTMFQFNNWTVGGIYYGNVYSLSNPITMDADKTAVANWDTFYYLTVSSDHGNTSGTGYKLAGSYAYAGLDTDIVDGGVPGVDDTRYVFSDWDGDASGTDYAQSDPIHMTSAKHAIADWDTQYYLLVNNGGHSTTYGTDWYDAGDKAYFGINDTMVYDGSDTRYQFDDWDGNGSGSYNGDDPTHYVYMNNAITETATWNTQYKLTVTSGGKPNFVDSLPDGDWGSLYEIEDWYDEGTTAYARMYLPFEYYEGILDTRYLYTGWGEDATGDNRGTELFIFEYSQSDPIEMTGPKTAVAQWQTQYYLSVISLHGSTFGSGWYNEGADATFGVTSTIVPDGDGKRYEFDNWFGLPCGAYNGSDPVYTIQMTKHFIETATWDTQYRLIMYSEINDYSGTVAGGTTDPSVGEHWYDAGTWVQIQAYAPTTVDGERYTWNGWTGTPYYYCCCCCCKGYTGLGDGSTHSAWIEMNCPITETASWDHEYRLTMESYVTDASGTVAGGTTDPSVGEHWYLAGTPLDITAFAPALSYAEGERFTFDGWDGTGCGSYTGMDETHGINMNSPITQAATWLHEYRLIMEANYGTTDPTLGEHWYLAGMNVPITAIAPVPEPFETYGWNGWTGTGCGSYTGIDNPSFVNMYSPITQSAEWIYVPPGGGEARDERTGLVIVIDVEGNIASYPVTPDGALLVDVTQTSPDGNLTLSIPEGTIVLNPDGTAAYHNVDPDVIGIQAGAVASADGGSVIQAYDLTPTGLYFVNGEATLTARYNSDNVPEGTNVTWASYNADTGTWTDMETSGTVAADGEPLAACNTSSLTVFALIAK